MDEKYLQDLYNWIKGKDASYESRYSYQDFASKMQDTDYATKMHQWISTKDNTFSQRHPIDKFIGEIGGGAQQPLVEKKNPIDTALPAAGASSASLSQETEDDGILSKIGNAALTAQAATMLGAKKTADALSGIASNIWSEGFLRPVDDVLNAYKNQLVQSNFFGEDVPDTDKPASDAVKKQLEQLSKKKGGDMSPIDPRAILQGIGNVSSLIINSVLPQEQKTKSITALANASSSIKDQIKSIEDYQQKVAPEGVMKIPYEITKNIAGMAPDLVLAAAMDNPAYAESAAAKWAETTTKKAVPVIEEYSPQAAKAVEKYLPKATKLVKESATSPFTKIMATKGAIKGMAETEEGEDPYVNSLYGALEGAAEGAYMHVLGVTAGEVSPAIAKFISKTGLNSAIATAISNPLANAGVFTSAKALRVAATERRALTTEEIIMEAGTGVGFSLLHAGTIYKNQNEANHYYDSVLNDNPINSLGRVINETKDNLDVAYDPNLTKDDIQAMMTARDAIKKAILKEPDMQKKKTLGDEAVKLQNKIDAHNTVNDIVEHRDALIDLMNNNKSFGANEKKMIIDKISAIADAYDNSAFGTRKKELNTEIMNLDAELSDLSEKFTNSKLPSDRASIKAFIDAKRIKLGELNNELTELMTNKQKQDAIQKQATDEGVLLGQQPELGLQKVGEGDTKLEITPEQKQAITDEKDAFQEILDNPDNHDEADVQEAKDYFADPIAYYEEKIKFYEEETNPIEDDKASLEYFKKMLEAQKALKPEGTTIKVGEGVTVSETTPEVTVTPTPAKGETITVGASGATTTTSGGPTEVTTGGEGTETKTGGTKYETENTKIEDDGNGNLTVTLDGKPIGRMVYDKEFGNYVNADFNKAEAKPYTAKSFYGDVLGKTKEQAVNELLKRNSEANRGDVTMAEGRETRTGLMDDIELLIPKYKQYVDRDLKKAKDKLKVAKKSGNETKIEGAKKAVDKAKAAAEEYKKEVTDKKEEALKLLTESSEYKNADQVKQDALVKEVVRKFGERIKKSPSLETVLGIEPPKVVTMTEKAALKEQIKAFGRGVKEGLKTAKDLMERRTVFTEAIKKIEKSGFISAKKVDALLNKISKVNLEDDAAVEKVIEYAEKLFEDAEYDNKLSTANNERAAIRKLASNKKKNADLSVFAKEFLKIRPFDVDNINEYNEMAKKIRESLEGSKITKDKNNAIKIADMIDIAKMGDYVDKMLEGQYKIDKDKLIKSARGIMGDDATFLSDDEVFELIKTGKVEGNEKVDDSLLKKITERVDKIFDLSATMVEAILRTGKDPFTGDDIDLSDDRKKIVERFMSMDMKDLSDREKLGVIDALNNFNVNGSVANMETVYADYKAKDSLAKAIENNIVAKKIKLFFSKKIGRVFGQQISTLPNLTEQMFRGVSASEEFKRLSGITELVNKKAAVQRTMNVLTDSFIKQFYKQKANGKAFDTAENVAERGIIAAMKRDIPGTPEQQKAEFVRKKKLAEKSIELLRDGTEQERKLADVYQKAYDKVLKDSNTVDEVLKKSDDKNIEAVDWWIDKWSEIYDKLADVSESIYNKKLDRDLNYTNFKFSLLSGGEKSIEPSSRESIFHNSNNDIFGKGVYKKKTGVLEKSTRPEANNMEDRYFDLSFDRNMINAYQDALMDINTAGTVRQIESFFSSKAIKKIIPNKEDRDLLFSNNGKEGVVPDLIRTTRQRQVIQTDELTGVFRKLSNLGTAGAATALAGITQPIKQTIPVAINTLVNAGKMPDLFYFKNKDKVDFINNSQRSIAIRGGKSRVSVDSINKLAEAAATSKTSKIIDFLGKANEMALKTFIERPDVWIAKASWITYYEKGLKKQGIDPSKFDYGKDKINEEAADYAQDMVDRQQNISDADLQGKLMNTKDPLKSVMVKTVMPFASFRMNQTMRMYSDLKTAFSKKGEATKEDRVAAIKSLSGYSAEMAAFKYLQYFIASTLANAAIQAMGINETDDDKKKREDILKRSQTTGTVTDILSPLPMLDVPVAIGADKALSYFQDLEGIDDEDKFNLMTSFKQNGAKSLGLYGIAIDKANTIIEAFEISTTGEFTDEYGRKKYVSTKIADALGDIALMSVGSSLIGFPAEMNSVLRNSLGLAKKNSSTKEGGKEQVEKDKSIRIQTKDSEKRSKNEDEIKALEKILDEETDEDKIDEINNKIDELSSSFYKTKEEKEARKKEVKKEKDEMKELLQGYPNKSDMKRHDPVLYEQTFGEGSEYYEKNKEEAEVKSEMSKTKREMRDEEMNYVKPRRKIKNKDGSYKKFYYKSIYR